MPKVKTTLKEPTIDNRLLDERGPTVERLARTPIDIGDTGTITVRQSPIERAVRRGTLTERQGLAAEKFYMHWYRAGMAGTMGSADPLKVFVTSGDYSRLCGTEMAEFNYNRVRQALEVIGEKMDAAGFRKDHATQLLNLIVCQEMPFAEAGQAVGFRGKEAEIKTISYMRGNLNILIAEWGL